MWLHAKWDSFYAYRHNTFLLLQVHVSNEVIKHLLCQDNESIALMIIIIIMLTKAENLLNIQREWIVGWEFKTNKNNLGTKYFTLCIIITF